MHNTMNYVEGSSNVFADLGLEDAKELHRRSQIGFYVFKLLEKQHLTQREIGDILGIQQPEVSHLMNGHYSRFTTDKLLDFLQRLNQKVTISISPRREGEAFSEVRMAV